jgi:hypothetical protein
MNFYFSAPVWMEKDECPNTSKKAVASKWTQVNHKRVLVVKDGSYRNAVLNGTFLLAESELALPKMGWHKVEVYCCWFGRRLKTRGIRLLVNMSSATVDDSYIGQVVSNISR